MNEMTQELLYDKRGDVGWITATAQCAHFRHV
jgi:hypothetical protein